MWHFLNEQLKRQPFEVSEKLYSTVQQFFEKVPIMPRLIGCVTVKTHRESQSLTVREAFLRFAGAARTWLNQHR